MKKLSLTALLGIIILGLWFYYIDPAQTWSGIKNTNLLYLFFGYFFFFNSYGLKILRWSLILKKISKIHLSQVVKYYWACECINTFTPARMGDLSHGLLLKKNHGVAVSASISAMIMDRFYGIIVRLFVIGFIPLLASDMYPYLRNYLFYIVSLTAPAILFLIFLTKRPTNRAKIIAALLFFLPHQWKQKVLLFIENGICTIQKSRFHKSEILLLLGISTLSLIFQACRTYFFFKAVGIEMPIALYLVTTTLMDFLSILPSPPAGLGTSEWYSNIIYTIGLGISKNTVAGIAVVTHGITLCIIAILGVLSLSSMGYSLTNLQKGAKQSDVTVSAFNPG